MTEGQTRRTFLRASLGGIGSLAFGLRFYREAFAAGPAMPGSGPYGALGAYDTHGIALPPGFTSRLIARAGQEVAGTSYAWHSYTDGQATFAALDGGWILVANSEIGAAEGGGSSAIRFSPAGDIVDARRVLDGTSRNCSGGAAPWGTWLSCEEHPSGRVWECDPTGAEPPIARPAMGTFQHEAVCVDPFGERAYMTEDQPDGCLYRFTPDTYPDLSSGLLEAAVVAGDGTVEWREVADPDAASLTPTRQQVAGATRFNGGEGIWFDTDSVYFTTKGDRKIWAYDTTTSRLEIVYDRDLATDGSPLRQVDNVTVARSGDLYVCEDGDNHEICVITSDRVVSPFLRLDPAVHGTPGSNETTGVVFDPSGTRLYFGAQRTFGLGAVYEISGPFRREVGPVTAPTGNVPPPAPPAVAGAAPGLEVPVDEIAPGVRLGVAHSMTTRGLLEPGLSVLLTLDEPAGVELELRHPRLGALARRRTTVAVDGRVRLRLRPRRRAMRRRLRGRSRRLHATLVVRVQDAAGNRRTVRRPITLRPS